MANNNIRWSVEDISNENNLEGLGVLTSDFFPVATPGIPTITIDDLIDATIMGLWREDAPWEEVDELVTLTDKTYHFDETTGDLVFFTDLNPNEKIYVLWYTGAAPTTFSEPVDIDYFKHWARTQGFSDADGSLDEFDYDDAIIADLLPASRAIVEKYNEISIVTHRWELTVTNCAGYSEIPNGPVNAIGSWVDSDGNSLMSDYKLLGRQFPKIKSPRQEEMVIQYIAGYTNVPEALKIAICQQALYMYEHRGEEKDFTLCEMAINTSISYNKRTWLA